MFRPIKIFEEVTKNRATTRQNQRIDTHTVLSTSLLLDICGKLSLASFKYLFYILPKARSDGVYFYFLLSFLFYFSCLFIINMRFCCARHIAPWQLMTIHLYVRANTSTFIPSLRLKHEEHYVCWSWKTVYHIVCLCR